MTKKLQKQFADFKAEFATLCRQYGGQPDERGQTAGPDSAFNIPCADPQHGILRASIHDVIDFEGKPRLGAGRSNYSSAEIFISFRGEVTPPFAATAGDSRPHWKWNIHRSTDARGMYVECCNEALTEFSRRLARACLIALMTVTNRHTFENWQRQRQQIAIRFGAAIPASSVTHQLTNAFTH